MGVVADNIRIAPIGLEALPELRTISIQTFLDTYARFNTLENVAAHIASAFQRDQLAKELQHPEMFYYFLFLNDELAGYLKLNIGDSQTEPKGDAFLEIERIYVLDDYKGRGFGRLFIEHSITKAKALDKHRLWLGVWEQNPKAIAFYEHVGFVKTGTHTFTVGSADQTDFVMELPV